MSTRSRFTAVYELGGADGLAECSAILALVRHSTLEGPQMDKRILLSLPPASHTFAHTSVTLPQANSNIASKSVPQAVDKPVTGSRKQGKQSQDLGLLIPLRRSPSERETGDHPVF